MLGRFVRNGATRLAPLVGLMLAASIAVIACSVGEDAPTSPSAAEAPPPTSPPPAVQEPTAPAQGTATPTQAPTATVSPAPAATAAARPTATPSVAPTAPAGEQLRIGFLADFSGPLAELGPVIQTGIDLAIKHINAAGGVNGQDVVLVTGDTRLDPTQGVEEARRLIEVEGVHAIVGPLSSTVTLAVAEDVAADASIPVVSPSASSQALSAADDDGYLFRSTLWDGAYGVALARATSSPWFYRTAGVLYRDDAHGRSLSAAFTAAYRGTATVVAYSDINSIAGNISYLAQLRQAAAEGAPVLVIIGSTVEATFIRGEARQSGLFAAFIHYDSTQSSGLVAGVDAEYLEGMLPTALPGTGTPSLGPWRAAYEAEHRALPSLPFVMEAYDAAIALALAVEGAGSTDGADIRDQLPRLGAPGGEMFLPGPEGIAAALAAVRNGDDIDYEGAATTLDWNAAGDITSGYFEYWHYPEFLPPGADYRWEHRVRLD